MWIAMREIMPNIIAVVAKKVDNVIIFFPFSVSLLFFFHLTRVQSYCHWDLRTSFQAANLHYTAQFLTVVNGLDGGQFLSV